jgi:hypothetical protein
MDDHDEKDNADSKLMMPMLLLLMMMLLRGIFISTEDRRC